MRKLPPAVGHCVRAAAGWLELKNAAEARAELAEIPASYWNHPAVLEMRWLVAAAHQDWEAALEAARQQMQQTPDRVDGYLHQAYALRRIKSGGLEKARAALLPAAKLFPEEEVVSFNLACYETQLGRLDEAWNWLQRAVQAAEDASDLLRRALDDEDLQPLWERINRGWKNW